MKKILQLPHRVCQSTCYINGLEDIMEWKGVKYPDYLLSILGGTGEFAYITFKSADPPNMVYCGANPKYLLDDLEKIMGFKQEILENRVFKNTLPEIKEFIDNGNPVVAGALDMYYLHYFEGIYLRQHIPIHYVLVVGYDDEKAELYVQDCTYPGVQSIPYLEFEKSLNVNVPGMSKKNTIRIFIINGKPPSEFEIAKIGLNLRSDRMLKPPVNLLGIPAMKKLAREIFKWEDKGSFNHLITYATIPPHVPKTFENSNGMRFWKANVLKELGNKYNMDNWLEASLLFEKSGELFKDICKAATVRDKTAISELILKVANIEEQAYEIIRTKEI